MSVSWLSPWWKSPWIWQCLNAIMPFHEAWVGTIKIRQILKSFWRHLREQEILFTLLDGMVSWCLPQLIIVCTTKLGGQTETNKAGICWPCHLARCKQNFLFIFHYSNEQTSFQVLTLHSSVIQAILFFREKFFTTHIIYQYCDWYPHCRLFPYSLMLY